MKRLNTDDIINDIINIAIFNLKEDFEHMGISTIEINNLRKQVFKIKRTLDYKLRVLKIKMFLFDNYKFYKNNKKTPLNRFYKECGKIGNKNFTLL